MSSSAPFLSVECRDFSPPREVMYDLELSRQMVTVKFFRVILPNSFHWLAGNKEHGALTGIQTTDWIPSLVGYPD